MREIILRIFIVFRQPLSGFKKSSPGARWPGEKPPSRSLVGDLPLLDARGFHLVKNSRPFRGTSNLWLTKNVLNIEATKRPRATRDPKTWRRQ